uniref:ORF60c n=1 Tax=Pinus koraiensis TaxID=88728 RepID=A4QMK2_PINKO|nr:ORF60c [Pinus koraiensis]ABP35322.1 ORF60c [Pinus koraiensis]
MSRDNKRVIPLRIFFNLEQPTKPINEIGSYDILDGIAANSVNPQVLPPPPFFFFLFSFYY